MALREGRTRTRLGAVRDAELDVQLMRTLAVASQGGAELGELLPAISAARKEGVTGYTHELEAAGDRLVEAAPRALADGQREVARDRWLRASTYFRSAMGLTEVTRPALEERWRKARHAFEEGARLAAHPFVPFDVPYGEGGRSLPCFWLRPADDDRPRPTLFVATGGEGTAFETYFWIGREAVRRGYNVLLYEGPINVSALIAGGYRFEAACERPMGAVVDRLERERGHDPAGLVVVGYSFGGWLAARAAACDPRFRGVIPDSPIVDPYALFTSAMPAWARRRFTLRAIDRLLPLAVGPTAQLTFQLAFREFGVTRMSEWVAMLEPLGLTPQLPRIQVPALSLCGADEGAHFLEQARAFHEGIGSHDRTFHCFRPTDGTVAHCQLDNPEPMRAVIFTWLASRFPGRPV
jgi:pimeloyl-ACP methyl ester carboxylesterase